MATTRALSHSHSAHHLLLRLSSRSLSFFSTADDVTSSSSTTTSSSSSSSRPKQGKHSHRLASVVDAVNERKSRPELRSRPNAIRSETDIENVVEHRVWRSMEEGQFENLPGKGKPLNLYTNPHVDPAEDTLYRILSRNGCTPEWVELNKEIRGMITTWRSVVKKAWVNRSNDHDPNWLDTKDRLMKQMGNINRKVLHYNLIVPFGRQMCGLKWEKEIKSLESE